MKLFRLVMMSCLLFSFAFLNIGYAAPPEIILSSEIYSGMRGYGKTVVSGVTIEQFDVEVIDVMKNMGSTGGDLILVRVSGDVIRRTGGVAQGMSGSPVFFDGRLAGAVAFGWSLSDPNICMLTPITEMLKISNDMRDDLTKRIENKKPFVLEISEDDVVVEDINQTDSETAIANGYGDSDLNDDSEQQDDFDDVNIDIDVDADNDIIESYSYIDKRSSFHTLFPKGTAITASGFSERGLEILKNELQDYNIVPYSIGTAPYEVNDVILEPGSAVSVEVIRGEVSLGALGTVTWVDDDEVLAFGHSFTKRGNVNYFLSNAWTFTTVSSINSSFRVGASGNLLGSILQDRGSGVAGKIGLYPDVMPVIITINDNIRDMQRTSNVQIIQEDALTPALAQASVTSIIDRAMDRYGEGTAKVKFTIRAQNLPDGKEVVRENMFYSNTNIGENLANEMALGLYLLASNRFQKVEFTDVTIDIDITDKREVATILSARPLVESARPGETIGVEVTLQPYRGEKVTRIAKFVVPQDHRAGDMPLMIRGGTSLRYLQALVQQQRLAETAFLLREDSNKNKTFADEIDEFNNMIHNNDIVIDLMLGSANNAEKTLDTSSEKKVNEYVQGSKYQRTITVPYVVTGETSIVVRII